MSVGVVKTLAGTIWPRRFGRHRSTSRGDASASEMPVLVLLNKADKLKRNAQHNALRAMQDALRDMPLAKTELFSAQSGQGCEAVIGILSEWLAAGQEDDDA